MSQPDSTRDPVMTAQALTAAVSGLAAEAGRLRRYGKRNRLFIAVDIALTLLLSGVGALSVHAVQSAGQANSAQLALCQAGNEARAQQVGLWEYILHLSGPPRTARQKEIDARFEQHLHAIFAPRDCSQLGR